MKNILFVAILSVVLFASCSSDDDLDDATSSLRQTVEHLDSNYNYELPVIFHVLYKDQSDPNQFIPYQRLVDILKYVNNIYEGNIYGESENLHLKFVLATKDENGNTLSTPGVEYVKYTGSYPIDPSSFMNDNTGKNVKYIWEPNNYINVMMYNFKQDSDDEITLGISDMPYTVKGSHQLNGLETASENLTKKNLKYAYCSSINSLFANTYTDSNGNTGYYQSSRYTDPGNKRPIYYSADIVVTLAHELGHYLGLFHTFSEVKSNGSTSYESVDTCADTDYCTDTYSYNRNDYLSYEKYLNVQYTTPSLELLIQRKSCDGISFEAYNIMDYTWTLGYQITAQQKARIRNVLNYSPLIPGPKLDGGTRAIEISDKPLNLKITTIK